MTNLDAARVHTELLGGPPVVGKLYRVGILEGAAGERRQFIGEYAGAAEDPQIPGELAYSFIVRNPPLPADAQNGSEDNPMVVWPIDLWHLSQSEPGDMDVVMVAEREGDLPVETEFSKLGLPRSPGGKA